MVVIGHGYTNKQTTGEQAGVERDDMRGAIPSHTFLPITRPLSIAHTQATVNQSVPFTTISGTHPLTPQLPTVRLPGTPFFAALHCEPPPTYPRSPNPSTLNKPITNPPPLDGVLHISLPP
jgi:hypothetical protein